MVDLTAIATAVSALNAMKDIASAMKDVRDAHVVDGKVGEFNEKLIEAQSAIFAVNQERTTLIETVRDLEKQIADFEKWSVEKDRYELKDLTNKGTFVYSLKVSAQPPEPPHSICCKCYQDQKKSILQYEYRPPASRVFLCHRCGSELYASGSPHPRHSRLQPSQR